MTAMKPAFDLLIDANVVLVLAFCLWRMTHAMLGRSALRHDYSRQLLLLKLVLLITIISPLIALVGLTIGQALAPKTPLTISDIAVAAYLRGEISIPAVEFEALLNTRDRWIDAALESQSVWMAATKVAFALVLAFFAVRMAWSLWRVKRVLDGSFLWRRTRSVDIRVSDTVGIPFAARGIFRRHVVLPSALLTRPRELKVVLAHEFEHVRSGDVEWEIAIELIRPLLFWNPAFFLWKRSFDQLRELSCDQKVIVARRISPHEYARCLLDFCERRLSGRWPRIMNVALVRSDAWSARRTFEARIRAMYHAPSGGGRAWMCGTVAILAVGVSLAAASVRKPGDWSHDRLMLSTIVNLERLEAINRGY